MSADAKRKSKVYLFEWRSINRFAMRRIFAETSDIEIVGWSDKPDVTNEKINLYHPDLVVTDLFLADLSGLKLIARLAKSMPQLPVLATGASDDPLYAMMALDAGARGYILINRVESEEIVRAVRLLLKGERYLSAELAADVAHRVVKGTKEVRAKTVAALSPRELAVFHLIGEGHSTGEIAENLRLSPKTVLAHRARIQQKMGFRSSSRLIQNAVQWVYSQGI